MRNIHNLLNISQVMFADYKIYFFLQLIAYLSYIASKTFDLSGEMLRVFDSTEKLNERKIYKIN